MPNAYHKLYSGEDNGGGADTSDEGYLAQYQTYAFGVWATSTVFVSNDTHVPPEFGPDKGHLPVGYIDVISATLRHVNFRSFMRFDLTGVDRANVVAARLTIEKRDGVYYAGHANDDADCEFLAGWNVIGAGLRANDWGRTFPTTLFTVSVLPSPQPLWPGVEESESYDFPSVQWIRDAAAESPFMDIRMSLANYTADDIGFHDDLSSGDNAKTDAPYLEIWTESAPRIVEAEMFSGEVEASIPAPGTVEASIPAGTVETAIQAPGTVPAITPAGTVKATLMEGTME